MIANYEEHGFEVTAEILPGACTACPFYGYSVESDTGICSITLNDIRTDGPQDEERERDCPIKERKTGKWERHNTYHGDDTSGFVDPDWRCSECGKNALVNEYMMYDLTEFCPNCGAKMNGG